MALATAVGSLLLASAANAATLTVDDDRTDCPTAQYTSIQAAIDAAATGDTVAVCPGNYEEGTGAIGTNALTISKSLTLKGAGAGLVHISPKASSPVGGQILEASPNIRNGVGDIIAVDGTPTRPLTVDISGVTVDGYDSAGRPIAVEAGIVFVDAKGSISRSRVTNVVTSEGNDAYNKTGGWRGTQPGIGIAQTSNALLAPVDGARKLTIDRTRVDKYNQVGILIDGATNDTAPLTSSGTVNSAVITASQIVGRTECVNYAGTGNCSSVGLLTTGPLFGQDGIRVTAGARMKVSDTLISQNLVNGAGAPVRTTVSSSGTVTPNSTNNANLALGAGIRLVGASLTSYSSSNGQVVYSSASSSNITDNAYGVLNLAADGTTTATGSPTSTGNLGNVFKAENNWWGENYYRSTNPGPAVAPTDNPPVPENPISGTASVADGSGTTSNSVDYYPYRSGQQSDMSNGEWPVLSAPIPVDDAAPTVTIAGDATVYRGRTMTLVASASDDFGVKSVTFYDGTTKLGTSKGPDYRATEAIPADAACGTRTVSAIAEDSLGQTTVSSGTITVSCDTPPTDPDDGSGTPTTTVTVTTPGETTTVTTAGETRTITTEGETKTVITQAPPADTPAAPASPTIGLAPVSGKLKVSGATLALTPSAPAGVKQVALFLGTRKVCTLTAAPWSCRVVPNGSEVGDQVLRAVVVDTVDRSAEATQSVVVGKFTPRLSVSVASKGLTRTTVRKTIKGKVVRPTGVTAAQGCQGGTATIVVKRYGRSISNAEIDVKGDCSFTKTVTARRVASGSGAFSYSVRFNGTSVLSTASSTRRSS
ncbi:MAG TPA: Ig-like domain-containing protein [Baekduia sp.]|uniref:Ig-like domain-containing protein n=1 Tax=Baekduia sp. TaxID=2600305 RepID=UPI002D78C66A|nr:Ig-like domain-containing protein [Baekduia sp.]HET6507229.1 Ig-like domain-containing protein [Baekduia sp.]